MAARPSRTALIFRGCRAASSVLAWQMTHPGARREPMDVTYYRFFWVGCRFLAGSRVHRLGRGSPGPVLRGQGDPSPEPPATAVWGAGALAPSCGAGVTLAPNLPRPPFGARVPLAPSCGARVPLAPDGRVCYPAVGHLHWLGKARRCDGWCGPGKGDTGGGVRGRWRAGPARQRIQALRS